MKTVLACPASNGNGAASTYQGGAASLWCIGTWDSGTVKLQGSIDGGITWIDLTDDFGDAISLTANGRKTLWEGGKPLVRLNLAGSSGATSLTCEIHYGLANTRDADLGVAL